MLDHPTPEQSGHWPELPASIDLEPLLDIIAAGAKIERAALTPQMPVEALGIDSLDMVDILFEIEDRTGIYISMTDGLTNAGTLAEFIAALAGQIDGAEQQIATTG